MSASTPPTCPASPLKLQARKGITRPRPVHNRNPPAQPPRWTSSAYCPPTATHSQGSHRTNHRASKGRPPPEPPLYLKLLLAELRFARSAPGADRNRRRAMLGMDAQGAMSTAPTTERETATAAIDHLATLALRHFAGSPELKPKSQERKELFAHLQDITDYCWAEPDAAIQARTFAGLAKASHRWHHEHLLREIAAELEAQRIADARPWQVPCPLPPALLRRTGLAGPVPGLPRRPAAGKRSNAPLRR